MVATEKRLGVDWNDSEETGAMQQPDTLKQVEDSLNQIVSTLRAATASTGEKFVGLGTALQALYAECESLFQSSTEQMEMLRTGNAGRLLEDIAAAAAQSVSALKSGQERDLELFGHIQDTIGVVKTLSKSVESINVVGSQLGIIGTNLAIQTSRLQSNVETFGDFASEIKSFSAYITRFAANIEQDTDEVVSILSDVKTRMEKRRAHMETYIDQAETSGNLTILEIQSLIRQSAADIEQKSRHSETISKEVTKAVIAIQVDDISRQRLEHVIDALVEILRIRNFSEAHMVLKLQARHVREVAGNLAEAHHNMAQAFNNVSANVSEIAPSNSYNTDASGQNAALSLRNLQRTLSSLEKIHEDARELRHSMSQGLDRAISASETISRHVVDVATITQELNLKAINALLMSRRLGSDGGNLVVLAKELHTLSKDSIEFVNLVQQKIEHVAQVTTMLKQKALAEDAEENTAPRFESQLKSMDETVAFYDKAANDAGKRATQIRRQLQATETALVFMRDLAGRLAEKAVEMEHITQISEAISASESGDDVGNIAALYDKYTMEQERRAHREMTGGTNIPNGPTYTAPTEEDDLGSFELF